jgi:benzoate-CoA ligase
MSAFLHRVPAPPEQFNFAEHLLSQNISRGSKAAFIDDATEMSFAELSNRVRAFAGSLVECGVRREERALLLMHDCNDWPVAFLGAMYAGIVPVAVNTLLTADDYAYMLQHSRAQAAIVSAALLPTLEAALAIAKNESGLELRAIFVSKANGAALPIDTTSMDDAIARAKPLTHAANTRASDHGFWLYSSGSTGRPKGTVHTHSNPYWTSELYGRNTLQMREDDVCFSAAKLFFAYGLGNALTFPMSVGATTILMAERPTPDAVFKRWRGEIGAAKPTIFFGAPTGYAGMLASRNLPAKNEVAMRLASSAGEALPADIGERFTKHFGVEIIDGIGSTEMLHIFLSNVPGKVCYGTTGRPVPGYEIELRGDSGGGVQDGEPGDLYIRGESAALCYWGNREKSRETFQGAWTKSGDKYVKNADGTYTYSGRSDDMLKVSGIYVSPFEVESTLMQHAAVLEAAVIGIADADGLTKTKAFVVLKAGQIATDAELKAFVKDKLAPYKYPRLVEFVNELPKTATGKIQRFRLREQSNAR